VRAALFAICMLAAGTSAAQQRFQVEAELEQGRIYVGGETILRIRLARAPGMPYGILRPPAMGDALEVWSLGPARWFQAQREGVPWDVHERTYLLVPRRGGSLTIPGAEVEGPLRRQALPREAAALRGPALTLEVRPVPPGASEPWLPARQVTLEESWSHDPGSVPAGAALTRTIILRAHGVPGQRLPRVEMVAQPGLRVHHDQPELATDHHESGTVGRVIQRIVLVPLDDAEVILPVLAVQWWDVVADASRTATLPARKLRMQSAFSPAALPAAPDFSPAVPRAIAAAFAMLLAVAVWWRVRREPLRDARKLLREACRKNDPSAARDALIRWRNAATPGAAPRLLRAIGRGWDDAARAQLGALDAALYGRHRWDGREFWRRVRPWLRRRLSSRAASAPLRPAFFKLQATDASAAFRD
jgi:hypothetical protein